jgi:large subunit ribosomal protein L13
MEHNAKQRQEYAIDAADKRLGRVATEAARALMGKHMAEYEPQAMPKTHVHITGAAGLIMDERKQSTKIYKRYSGYPGGQKTETLAKVIADKGASEALRRAIYGMLPGNKLRARRMKLLTIEE